MNESIRPQDGAGESAGATLGIGADAFPGAGQAVPGTGKPGQGALGALHTADNVDRALDPLRAVRDYLRTIGSGDGDEDANGAPALAPSKMAGHVEDLALALQLIQTSMADAQAAGAMSEIRNNGVKLKASQAEQNAKYQKSVESARKAEAKSGGVLGFFKKLFKIVAAVAGIALSAVAVAATGGAAGPLLAFAIVGAISATVSLVSEISQAAGGPPISISSALTKMGTALATLCGASEADAEKIGKVVGNAIGLVTPLVLIDPSVLGELAGGIASLAGANATVIGIIGGVATVLAVIAQIAVAAAAAPGKAVGGANDIMKTLANVPGLKSGLTVAKGLAEGGGSLTGGTQSILVGQAQLAADNARADAKVASVQSMKLQQQMDDLLDEVRKLFDQIEEGYRSASQLLGRASQSYQLLSRNMGGRLGA